MSTHPETEPKYVVFIHSTGDYLRLFPGKNPADDLHTTDIVNADTFTMSEAREWAEQLGGSIEPVLLVEVIDFTPDDEFAPANGHWRLADSSPDEELLNSHDIAAVIAANLSTVHDARFDVTVYKAGGLAIKDCGDVPRSGTFLATRSIRR